MPASSTVPRNNAVLSGVELMSAGSGLCSSPAPCRASGENDCSVRVSLALVCWLQIRTDRAIMWRGASKWRVSTEDQMAEPRLHPCLIVPPDYPGGQQACCIGIGRLRRSRRSLAAASARQERSDRRHEVRSWVRSGSALTCENRAPSSRHVMHPCTCEPHAPVNPMHAPVNPCTRERCAPVNTLHL